MAFSCANVALGPAGTQNLLISSCPFFSKYLGKLG